jgi:hypothetical protein
MGIDIKNIKAFLNRPGIEGPQQLRGYIPCDRMGGGTANYRGQESGDPGDFFAMGISGVTVATGVDLGQTDAETLTRGGLSGAIAASLRPYLGLRKEGAIKKLYDLPLSISRETADELDNAVLSIHARNIPARYNRDKPAAPFEDLPWQAQAAIFSLLFQRGTGVAGREPDIWEAFLLGEWAAASRMLCNASRWSGAQEQYRHRRKLEGELLREIV